jgi:hypothetical protein
MQNTLTASRSEPANHIAPSAWRYLSRDWIRWSMVERAIAVLVAASAPIFFLTIAYVLA